MKVVGVIPARYNSTRFEGKVIADLLGKPIIQHVYEKAKAARLLDDLIVAADDDRVVKIVKDFGGKVIYTSPKQPTGSDRIAEVVNPLDVKIVINIQGDEPLIEPKMIDELARVLLNDEKLVMATLVKKINNPEDINNPNVVKVVIDRAGFALYFSRFPIPYVRICDSLIAAAAEAMPNEAGRAKNIVYYKHIGLYAYTKDFLFTFTNLPPSPLEEAEELEQLRALEYGYKIKTVETEFETVGVDTPQDLEKAKETLTSSRKAENAKNS